MTTTTLGTANQLPSWGHLLGRAEYLLFKTRFGTVGEPNEVICQSQQDRFCLGVRSARCRDRFGGTVVPIGWIVRKPEGHIRRSPNPPPTPQARSNTIRCQRPEVTPASTALIFCCRLSLLRWSGRVVTYFENKHLPLPAALVRRRGRLQSGTRLIPLV
jgi:hypothetical protein